MEDYLKKQYNVQYDPEYLATEEDIIPYFKDNGREYFDCGQGYYEDEISLLAKVGDKFYQVFIEAEIMSAKQDYGERLYWIEDVRDVTFKEVSKPVEHTADTFSYKLELTAAQKSKLESFLDDNEIKVVSKRKVAKSK